MRKAAREVAVSAMLETYINCTKTKLNKYTTRHLKFVKLPHDTHYDYISLRKRVWLCTEKRYSSGQHSTYCEVGHIPRLLQPLSYRDGNVCMQYPYLPRIVSMIYRRVYITHGEISSRNPSQCSCSTTLPGKGLMFSKTHQLRREGIPNTHDWQDKNLASSIPCCGTA